MAANITPLVANAVNIHGLAPSASLLKLPIRMVNSPTKPFKPGTPMDDNMITMNAAAKIGATFWIPFNSAIWRVCRRS